MFKLGFDWPVRLVHGFARLVRDAPGAAQVLTAVAALYSVFALFAGVKWWGVFVWPAGEGLQVSGLLALIIVPAVVLGTLPEILRWQHPRCAGLLRSYGPWVLLGGVAALAAAGVVWLERLRTGLAEFLEARSGAVSAGLLAGCAVAAGVLLVKGFRWALCSLRGRKAPG